MREIKLTKGQVALVDDSDYDFLNQWKWKAHRGDKNGRCFYASRTVWKGERRREIFMHQLLLDIPEGMETDHQDGNGLNNSRQNLRACTRAQNQGNSVKRTRRTSAYKGVCWCASSRKWKAYIRRGEKMITIGRFINEADAARAYNGKAMKYRGEFARLNIIANQTSSG